MNKALCCALSMVITAYTTAQIANRFDVLIHELLPDPSPPVGLPNSEFIELRNNSASTFNLRNWKITDGSSTATITVNYLLQADSCVVICAVAALPSFANMGPAIGVSNFPSLNNDADIIWLLSPEGRVIHAVAYTAGWYQNAVKSAGGWSLEMMDANNPCTGAGNWQASINTKGGTPGFKNSIEANNPDDKPPALLRTYAVDSVTIAAVFDEPLDSSSAASINHYKLNKGLSVVRAVPTSPVFTEVFLTVSHIISKHEVYLLEVFNVTDCASNTIGIVNSARAGFPVEIEKGQVVINEILFNPTSSGTDYIEFYNNSNKIVDATAFYIGSRSINGTISSLRKLSDKPFLFFPGDYLVVTANAITIQTAYVTKHPLNILTIDPLPSLPNDKGNIVLLNEQGIIIDELSYDEKWHFPLIANREGVALERIDVALATQNKDNWTSAASDVGHGTPTYRNSQYKSFQVAQAKLEVSEVFSPDNDGMDDHCFIHYQLTAPNSVASVTIFDLTGHVVRNLVSSASLSEKGFFRWDGLNNKGGSLPMGIYIVLTELFDLQGNRNNFKNYVTLARRF